MSKLYLITGFLGAGKTTFLKNFIRLFPGQKLQLIVNEFGKEGVDGALLSGLGGFLQEISGGSVFCSCRFDQFEKVLAQSAQFQADVILVEASGLSNPTGVRKLFSQENRFPHIQYMGGICLIDALRFPKLYATARTCVKQLASSDVAVVNKVDLATEEQLEKTESLIKGQRPGMPLLETSFGRVDPSVLELLAQTQGTHQDDMPLTADLSIRKLNIKISPTISSYELQKFIEMFLEDTFRVKGFIETSDGLCFADCVGNIASITPYSGEVSEEKKGWLTVLSGAGMPVRHSVTEASKWYPNKIISID